MLRPTYLRKVKVLNKFTTLQRATTTKAHTQYIGGVTQKYAQMLKDMHYLIDGWRSTMQSHLEMYNKQCNLDPSQMKVIDMACGDGQYSRFLLDKFNYAESVGVDISESQIESATKLTDSTTYPNIKYKCLDIGTLSHDDHKSMHNTFDIALTMWLYNYAADKDILSKYIASTYNVLKPGGFVIGVTISVQDLNDIIIGGFHGDNPKFGIFTPSCNQHKEGPFKKMVGRGPDPFELNVFLYKYDTYQQLFMNNGFTQFRFLESMDYVIGKHSTEEQQKLFIDLNNQKDSYTKMFVAQK